MMLWSLPHEEVMSVTASFRRWSRSFKTPSIMRSGMSMRRMSPPTPNNLNIVLERRLKNGCDFGSGGGASGMAESAEVRFA